ncbi:thiamine biosynthesis protein ThiF [Streptomyces sp. Root63]|uniref:ThiF family adenylyltransferase n=1 Tax=unclassified Streptomyces TaxID=2593676 RepID=UPI0006F4BAE4|nr:MULTISPECIES: ThiF family adenylyltransferase [unclassified Streptomyces]KQX36022.1 thiamine biosynthesis protein ThiF [Streptomyces sp. Root1295]KRA39887.1 thiamine biosynthesis protein ThiF [Streptomyces sp. Root63]
MHPMLKPALRRAWRGRNTVQFGVTPAHAVTLGPVDLATGSFLELLDGTRGLPLLHEEARALDLPERHVDTLLARLAEAGLLDDPRSAGPGADVLCRRAEMMDRQRPDVASLSVVRPEPGGSTRRMAARRAMRVQVRGAGRVGASIASVLSGAGVGHVEVLDGGRVEPWDVAPAGLAPASVGERRDVAARRLVRRSAPGPAPRRARTDGAGADLPGSAGQPGLSLIVVAPRDGLAVYAPVADTAGPWIASGTPHLYAGVIEATGVVGPLVLPGGTGCAGCLELHRADRDPQWPRMLAQWRSGRRGAVPACDLGLATAVAGLASAHALAFLDGDLPACTGARWEAALPLLDWRSEPIGPHADCSCGAAGGAMRDRASGGLPAQDTMAG